MDRITLHEFIDDIRESRPILRDGHELGLIIDESNGHFRHVDETVSEIAKRTPTVLLQIDEMLHATHIAKVISATNGGEALVLLRVEKPLRKEHYAALQSLVSYHALEEWKNNGTVREEVPLSATSRFILVIGRDALEEMLRTFTPIRDILGLSLSIDGDRTRGVL